MTRKAQIDGSNIVVNMIEAGDGFALPGYTLVAVDGAVEIGAVYDPVEQTFTPPEPPVAERRLVPKSVVIARLTDQQVADAIALLTPKQQERWRASDKPEVYFDDPETLAILIAIGADPDAVMAPPD